MIALFVGGQYGSNPKASGYAKKLIEAYRSFSKDLIVSSNGGPFDQLRDWVRSANCYDSIFWFPSVANDEEKLIAEIKKNAPKSLLVSSKRNNQEYSTMEVIVHALRNKSNLVVEFSGSNPIRSRLMDPLGNLFVDTTEISTLAQALAKRVSFLRECTRLPSISIGPARECPSDEKFFQIVRDHAHRFHELIHGANTDRLLGNTAFRCMHGFPAKRDNDILFVSRRNIDKQGIGPDGFVAVNLYSPIDRVEYYGQNKPSVDASIQISLFRHYRYIQYALHSHVYVPSAPFTQKTIPCGAVEEVDEILRVFPSTEEKKMAINLRGHGSLVLSDDLDFLRSIQYNARTIPELAVMD